MVDTGDTENSLYRIAAAFHIAVQEIDKDTVNALWYNSLVAVQAPHDHLKQ